MKIFFTLLLSLIVLCTVQKTAAQSCFNVNAGKDTTISCLQGCLNLKARIPNIKTTEDYTVTTIPYAPYAYQTPGGTQSNLVYDDDHFSDSFALPFKFCFFGRTYSQVCVGSNGVITFDATTNANKIEGYFIDLGDTIPFAGGLPDVQFMYYAPRASIFLAYYDLNPVTSPRNRKIEWRVEGTAPCRKFVVAYSQIGNFDVAHCPNNTNLCTMQAVLYEGTGVIDVFYENKPACVAYERGLAIAGIQNWEQDKAVVLPGKNGTVWTARKEGYRYIPNGTSSLFSRVELYKNNSLVATGTVADLGNGELEATFPNVCQTEDSMSYVVKAYYRQCNNPAVETEGSDTMIVYKTLNPLNLNVTSALCPGTVANITVTSPVAANIEYSIDGTNWQSSNSFTPAPGNYTVTARLVGSQCTGTTTATILPTPEFFANGSAVHLRCNNQPTGQVIFSPKGPNAPYQFSADGGITYQSGNVFTGLLAGTYKFKIKSSTGCIIDTTLIVTQPPPVAASAAPFVKASCANNDGELIITASGGTPFYNYSLDGVNYQTLNSFAGLASGTYSNLAVKDANGCVQTCNATTILVNDQMFLTMPGDTTICAEKPLQLIPATNLLTNTYKWSPSTALNFDNIKSPIATPSDTTVYFLTAQWGICSRTASTRVNVLRKPMPNAGKDTIVCFNSPALLNGSISNTSGPVKYYWWPSSVTPVNTLQVSVLPDSTQLYALLVNDNYGCHFAVGDTVRVTVRPKVVAFAGNDTIAVYGLAQQLSGTGGVNYSWSPAGSLNNPYSPNPVATLYSDTRLFLQVSNDIGCSASDDVLIKVYDGPTYYIPNAFTPNGDGINDRFTPIPVGIASTQYFRVYDRFGQLVFSGTDFLKGWDGKYKGNIATTGTYVWMIKGIDRNGKVIERKGTVLLLQ